MNLVLLSLLACIVSSITSAHNEHEKTHHHNEFEHSKKSSNHQKHQLHHNLKQNINHENIENVLEKLSKERSKTSANKITIEEAYLELGESLKAIKHPKSFDEVGCLKYKKLLLVQNKITATAGGHNGKTFNKTDDPAGRKIVEEWIAGLKNNEGQSFEHRYSYNGKNKKAIVYDFGEDDAKYHHLCVVKYFADNKKNTNEILKNQDVPDNLIAKPINKDEEAKKENDEDAKEAEDKKTENANLSNNEAKKAEDKKTESLPKEEEHKKSHWSIVEWFKNLFKSK